MRTKAWLAQPKDSEASQVCFSSSPQHRPTQPCSPSLSFSLSLLQGTSLVECCLCLTWSPHPAGPKALLSPALFLAPSPRPPQAARPSQGQAVLEKCWEVAECAVCEFPPNWRPDPWTNSGRVCLSTRACVLLPGQEIPGAGGRVRDRPAGRQTLTCQAHGGEVKTD